ncbi:MAG: hypothetical protein IPO60_05340 [Flavobacteriales bacterium]|nr:hypothetical protein [Flavobacteriales bacterium]
MRSAKEMGIATVAVYSEGRPATRLLSTPPTRPSVSGRRPAKGYLVIDKLLKVSET